MATRVDLNGILDNLKSIFDSANTTTASPIDLSSNLTTRVSAVMRLNPSKIAPQASLFPLVTCYVGRKSMSDTSIGKSQANIKRKAIVEIDVVGSTWNDTFNTVNDDPSDKDIHYLMENIEMILRSNENLTSSVLWQVGDSVEYFSNTLAEGSHLRSGILSLKATVYY